MKKDLIIIPKYIMYVILLTVFSSTVFLLYPFTVENSLDLTVSLFYIFLCVSIYLLPVMSVVGLLFILLREIKIGTFSFLSFLLYVFFCVFVWLIIIPMCIFFEPAKSLTGLLVPQNPYVSPFFDGDFLSIGIQNLSMYEIPLNTILIKNLSDISLLSKQVVVAVYQGKIGYLLFASLGLALSSLYGLKRISAWKLINVAVILTLWCTIIIGNILLFKYSFELYFSTEILACIFNSIITICVGIVSLVHTIRLKKKQELLVSEDE